MGPVTALHKAYVRPKESLITSLLSFIKGMVRVSGSGFDFVRFKN